MLLRSVSLLSLFGWSLLMASCNVQSRSSGPGTADTDAPEEFTETDSGLRYRILRKGDGQKPTADDTVLVDYVGRLDNHMEFDNSYGRREPASFAVRKVVPGFAEGLQLVREGGMIELEIPSELGYGPDPPPGSPVPPNATLHFVVELREIR